MPLQCLGAQLRPLECQLLIGVPAVRHIPVTVVFESASTGTRYAPVRHLVQRAGSEVLAVMDFRRFAGLSGEIKRFRRATAKAGIERRQKTVMEHRLEFCRSDHCLRIR